MDDAANKPMQIGPPPIEIYLNSLSGHSHQEWRVECMLIREGDTYPVTRYFHAETLEECFAKMADFQHDKKAKVLAITAVRFKSDIKYRPESGGRAFGEYIRRNPKTTEGILHAVQVDRPEQIQPITVPTGPDATPELPESEEDEEAAAKARLTTLREEMRDEAQKS